MSRARVLKFLAVVILLAAAVVAGLVYFCATAHVSVGYCFEARFTTFPPDDRALCRWVKSQTGVYFVSICREGPDGRLLKVLIGMSRNLRGSPPVPDLNAACESLGYGEPDGRFRRSEIEGTACARCEE